MICGAGASRRIARGLRRRTEKLSMKHISQQTTAVATPQPTPPRRGMPDVDKRQEEIPEDALDAVARNGVPAFFRYREAKAACGSRGRTGMDKKHKITRMVANSTIITGRIFRCV